MDIIQMVSIEEVGPSIGRQLSPVAYEQFYGGRTPVPLSMYRGFFDDGKDKDNTNERDTLVGHVSIYLAHI